KTTLAQRAHPFCQVRRCRECRDGLLAVDSDEGPSNIEAHPQEILEQAKVLEAIGVRVQDRDRRAIVALGGGDGRRRAPPRQIALEIAPIRLLVPTSQLASGSLDAAD